MVVICRWCGCCPGGGTRISVHRVPLLAQPLRQVGRGGFDRSRIHGSLAQRDAQLAQHGWLAEHPRAWRGVT